MILAKSIFHQGLSAPLQTTFGFAGFVPSGRVAVFPECVHKPWQFGSTVFQTAMVCVTSQTMAVW